MIALSWGQDENTNWSWGIIENSILQICRLLAEVFGEEALVFKPHPVFLSKRKQIPQELKTMFSGSTFLGDEGILESLKGITHLVNYDSSLSIEAGACRVTTITSQDSRLDRLMPEWLLQGNLLLRFNPYEDKLDDFLSQINKPSICIDNLNHGQEHLTFDEIIRRLEVS